MSAEQTNPLVLLVDDEWLNREMLEARLQIEGYRVITANNGEQALHLVDQHQPDILLLDARMPGLSGYEVCRRIKDQAHTRHIPVVMLTALESDEDRQAAIDAGVDYFMTKSLGNDLLIDRISTLLVEK